MVLIFYNALLPFRSRSRRRSFTPDRSRSSRHRK